MSEDLVAKVQNADVLLAKIFEECAVHADLARKYESDQMRERLQSDPGLIDELNAVKPMGVVLDVLLLREDAFAYARSYNVAHLESAARKAQELGQKTKGYAQLSALVDEYISALDVRDVPLRMPSAADLEIVRNFVIGKIKRKTPIQRAVERRIDVSHVDRLSYDGVLNVYIGGDAYGSADDLIGFLQLQTRDAIKVAIGSFLAANNDDIFRTTWTPEEIQIINELGERRNLDRRVLIRGPIELAFKYREKSGLQSTNVVAGPMQSNLDAKEYRRRFDKLAGLLPMSAPQLTRKASHVMEDLKDCAVVYATYGQKALHRFTFGVGYGGLLNMREAVADDFNYLGTHLPSSRSERLIVDHVLAGHELGIDKLFISSMRSQGIIRVDKNLLSKANPVFQRQFPSRHVPFEKNTFDIISTGSLARGEYVILGPDGYHFESMRA